MQGLLASPLLPYKYTNYSVHILILNSYFYVKKLFFRHCFGCSTRQLMRALKTHKASVYGAYRIIITIYNMQCIKKHLPAKGF